MGLCTSRSEGGAAPPVEPALSRAAASPDEPQELARAMWHLNETDEEQVAPGSRALAGDVVTSSEGLVPDSTGGLLSLYAEALSVCISSPGPACCELLARLEKELLTLL